MDTLMHCLGRRLAGRSQGRGRPGRDVRILDAAHFDGPESLAAMLGFLGVDANAGRVRPSGATSGPAGMDLLASVAW